MQGLEFFLILKLLSIVIYIWRTLVQKVITLVKVSEGVN